MRRAVLLLLGSMLLVSCATITTGRFEEVRVSSSPAQADAALVCEGRPSGEGKTPVTFTIRRNAGDCTLTIRKEGFAEQKILVEQGVNPAYWGNMILSPVPVVGAYASLVSDSSGGQASGVGLVGLGVVIFGTDFVTGAVHAHKPHNVDVVLKPK